MEIPIKRYRCGNSIVVISSIVILLLISTHTAVASEPVSKYISEAAHVDGNTGGGLGAKDLALEPSTQQDVQVENEVLCLALNIYFEARSETEQGQLAVGHVVMNRVANRHYPNTVCNVVRQGGEERLYSCQFSWWCDGRPDKPLNQKAWLKSHKLAIEIYFGHSVDPTDGALWYHADYVNPYWSDALVVGNKIGQHIFYLKEKRPKFALN